MSISQPDPSILESPHYWDHSGGYLPRSFQIDPDEYLVAVYNNYTGQFWFAITSKRFLAVRHDRKAERPPGTDWTPSDPLPVERPYNVSHAGSWDLAEVRGFHVIPRPSEWWKPDAYREIFRVDLRSESVLLRGPCDFPIGTRYYRIDDPSYLHYFVAILQLAVKKAAPSAAPIKTTLPPTLEDVETFSSHDHRAEDRPKQRTLWWGHPYEIFGSWFRDCTYSISETHLTISTGYFRITTTDTRIADIHTIDVKPRSLLFRTADVVLKVSGSSEQPIILRNIRDAKRVREIIQGLQRTESTP